MGRSPAGQHPPLISSSRCPEGDDGASWVTQLMSAEARVLSQLLRCGAWQGDQPCLLACPAAGHEAVCRRKGGSFQLIRVHVLRRWPEGNLAGCPGGELLALCEGGMGPFVLHPRPWQPAQGCLPQQRQGQLPTSGGVCLEGGLCHGLEGSENIKKKKKRHHLLTTSFTGSQGFFSIA